MSKYPLQLTVLKKHTKPISIHNMHTYKYLQIVPSKQNTKTSYSWKIFHLYIFHPNSQKWSPILLHNLFKSCSFAPNNSELLWSNTDFSSSAYAFSKKTHINPHISPILRKKILKNRNKSRISRLSYSHTILVPVWCYALATLTLTFRALFCL